MSIRKTAIWRLTRVQWQIWCRRWDNWRWDKVDRYVHKLCNDRPWRSYLLEGGTGGYLHWRCELGQDHVGRHRYINYTWDTGERVTYDPRPSTRVGQVVAQRKRRDYHSIMTWKEARREGRWLQSQYAKALSRE